MTALQNALSSKFLNHNDNAFHDLTIDKALYINKDIQMQPNVYYFSYYGNRTYYDTVTKTYRPTYRMQVSRCSSGRQDGTVHRHHRGQVLPMATATSASW